MHCYVFDCQKPQWPKRLLICSKVASGWHTKWSDLLVVASSEEMRKPYETKNVSAGRILTDSNFVDKNNSFALDVGVWIISAHSHVGHPNRQDSVFLNSAEINDLRQRPQRTGGYGAMNDISWAVRCQGLALMPFCINSVTPTHVRLHGRWRSRWTAQRKRNISQNIRTSAHAGATKSNILHSNSENDNVQDIGTNLSLTCSKVRCNDDIATSLGNTVHFFVRAGESREPNCWVSLVWKHSDDVKLLGCGCSPCTYYEEICSSQVARSVSRHKNECPHTSDR